MPDTILVAHASKHGATAEIAERIAGVLATAGLAVELRAASEVDDLAPYTAVVLGSAIYLGRWRRPASRLLIRHQRALATRPVWLFASGPTSAGDPAELVGARKVQARLAPVIERIGPRDLAIFHGKLDPAVLGALERWVVRAVGAEAGDLRDWEAIEAWAKGIAASLRASRAA